METSESPMLKENLIVFSNTAITNDCEVLNAKVKLSRAKSRRLRRKRATQKIFEVSCISSLDNNLPKENFTHNTNFLTKITTVLELSKSNNIDNMSNNLNSFTLDVRVPSKEKENKNAVKQAESKKSSDVDEVAAKLKNVISNEKQNNVSGKSREEIEAERKAKKQAKQQAKNKVINKEDSLKLNEEGINMKSVHNEVQQNAASDKTREVIKAEREAKKLAKLQVKKKGNVGDLANNLTEVTQKMEAVSISRDSLTSKDEVDRAVLKNQNIEVDIEKKPEKSKAELRAERRAKQEAQRAAKLASATEKATNKAPAKSPELKSDVISDKVSKPVTKKKLITQPQDQHKVKLFSHLYTERNMEMSSSTIHPAIVRLGEQYREGVVVGSNARCIAFINVLKVVIQDYITPPQKEFKRELESSLKPCMEYLHQCRPVSVSMTNALRFVKRQISQLPRNITDFEAKSKLQAAIDVYYKEQICTAAEAISSFVQNKIVDGDVILTFSCSSLIQKIFEDVSKNGIDFRVVVVDGRSSLEGREMLRRLIDRGIKCSYVLINAVSFIMGEVTKVLLGAHALLANGYVMSRVGTAQIAMVAQSFNVPVLVCCETHKFIERVQTDSFVYNEIGDPQSLVASDKPGPLSGWLSMPTLSPLNLRYDVTPPDLVTAVVTELAILPCTSVPVILRIKPTEIGY